MKKRIASLFMAIVMIASLGVNAMALDPVTITTSGVQKFDDVPTTHWAFAYVDKVTAAGMFHGLTPTWFGPSDNMTRAQFVTVLARMEGQGALESVPTDTKFSDVERTYRFAGPIAWATNTGIVEGYSDGTFRPTQAISRAQFAAMIHRYINYKKYDQTLANGKVLSLNVVNPEPAQFPDYEQVSDVFKADVDYARTHGLVQGFGDGTLRPNIAINRAQIAAILARFIDVLVDSGYLPFLDGADARNPIVIRNSTTSSSSGGGGGGSQIAATYTLTVNTVDNSETVNNAYVKTVSYGYSVDEADVKVLAPAGNTTTTATARIAQNGEVIFGVTPPEGKKLVSITSTDVDLKGSSLSGYSDARSFTMTKNATITVTFENSLYYYVLGLKGGQKVNSNGPLSLTTDTYVANKDKRKLDENVNMVSAFTYLYNDGDTNSTKFQNMMDNGALALILPAGANASKTYTIEDLSALGGASSAALEPIISSIVAQMGKVDFEKDYAAQAATIKENLAKAAVQKAVEDRAITNAAMLRQISTNIDNFVNTYVDTSGVKFSVTVATTPSAKTIAESLDIQAQATVTRSGSDATVKVTPVVAFKGGKTSVDIGGTATVRVTGNVAFKPAFTALAKESYRTQSAADLLEAAGGANAIPPQNIPTQTLTAAQLNSYDVSGMFDLGDYLVKAQAQVDKRITAMTNAIKNAGINPNDAGVSAGISAVAGKLAISNFAEGSGDTITLMNFSGKGYSDQLDGIIAALEQLRWAIVEAGGKGTPTSENAIHGAIDALYSPAKGQLGSNADSVAEIVDALAKGGCKNNPARLGDFYNALVDTGDYFNSGVKQVNIPTNNFYVNLITDMGVDLDKETPVDMQFVMWKIPMNADVPPNLFPIP